MILKKNVLDFYISIVNFILSKLVVQSSGSVGGCSHRNGMEVLVKMESIVTDCDITNSGIKNLTLVYESVL